MHRRVCVRMCVCVCVCVLACCHGLWKEPPWSGSVNKNYRHRMAACQVRKKDTKYNYQRCRHGSSMFMPLSTDLQSNNVFFRFFIVLFRCYFWDAAQRNPQISLVSQIIMVDVIKSCHICVVNGLSMEAGEVKGFLKGQLTHHCCWPPLSYSYPHLLNLNQEPKVWPFISWLSSGCLFHLPAHCCITPAPSFPISPPLSQPRNTWRAALKGRNLNPSSSNTSPLLLTPSLLPETITIPPCLPAALLSLFHFLLLPIS